jgi:hypothetical protein
MEDMMVAKVQVTAQHIADGERCSPENCPLALAIRDAVCGRISVGAYIAIVGDEVVVLPESAADFRRRFDCHGIGEPFEFELDCLAQ